MMRVWFLIFFFPVFSFAQNIIFSPGQTIERNVSTDYYDTDYLFITNNSNHQISLSFELINQVVPNEWHVSGCTNLICYTKIPEDGSFGDLPSGYQAYFSINLATNGVAGDANFRFIVRDESNYDAPDTIEFIYHASAPIDLGEPQPWAKINFNQNVVTVFLKDGISNVKLYLYDLSGNQVISQKIESIGSISLEKLQAGVYVVVIAESGNRRLVRKVVKI